MNIRAKEIDYHYNTKGWGETATIYEMPVGKKYSVICKVHHEYQERELHVRTFRTDSLKRAQEYARNFVA
jgi:hypothetical protein